MGWSTELARNRNPGSPSASLIESLPAAEQMKIRFLAAKPGHSLGHDPLGPYEVLDLAVIVGVDPLVGEPVYIRG